MIITPGQFQARLNKALSTLEQRVLRNVHISGKAVSGGNGHWVIGDGSGGGSSGSAGGTVVISANVDYFLTITIYGNGGWVISDVLASGSGVPAYSDLTVSVLGSISGVPTMKSDPLGPGSFDSIKTEAYKTTVILDDMGASGSHMHRVVLTFPGN